MRIEIRVRVQPRTEAARPPLWRRVLAALPGATLTRPARPTDPNTHGSINQHTPETT